MKARAGNNERFKTQINWDKVAKDNYFKETE